MVNGVTGAVGTVLKHVVMVLEPENEYAMLLHQIGMAIIVMGTQLNTQVTLYLSNNILVLKF